MSPPPNLHYPSLFYSCFEIFQAICFMLNIHLIYIYIFPLLLLLLFHPVHVIRRWKRIFSTSHSRHKLTCLLTCERICRFLFSIISWALSNGSSKRKISIEIDSLLHLNFQHHRAIFGRIFIFKTPLSFNSPTITTHSHFLAWEEWWKNFCLYFHSRLEHTLLQSWQFSLILLSSLQTWRFWVMQVI